MATVYKYVDPDASGAGDGGGDGAAGDPTDEDNWTDAYTSLSAWEAAEQTDLDAAGDTHVCYVRSGSGGDDTSDCTIDGWTTSSGNEILIECASGNRHSGKWDDSSYVWEGSGGNGTTFQVDDNYVSMVGLQFDHTLGNNANAWIEVTGTNFFMDKCIGRMTGGANNHFIFGTGASTGEIRNTIGYDFDDIIFDADTSAAQPSWYFRNCTGVNDSETTFATAYNDAEWHNCCAFDSTDSYTGTPNAATNNAYSEGTDPGSNGVDISSDAGTDLFTDYNNDDFHVKDTNSSLYDAGADLSGTFTDDIDSETRSQWDIGADEYVAAAPAAGQPTFKRFAGTPHTTTYRRW